MMGRHIPRELWPVADLRLLRLDALDLEGIARQHWQQGRSYCAEGPRRAAIDLRKVIAEREAKISSNLEGKTDG